LPYLRILNGLSTHREKNIDYIHKTQYDIANLRLVVAIAGEEEGARKDVVGKHLPVVFSPFFNIDNEDLLEPKCKLSEIVPFQESRHGSCREVGPNLSEVEPIFGVITEVLPNR
jgi:hypothetical protein